MSASVRGVLEAARTHVGQVPDFRLRPGASAELVRAVEDAIGFALPRDVRDLYLEHDGQDADGVGFLFGWSFDPLGVALSNWRLEREAYGDRRCDWSRGEEDRRGAEDRAGETIARRRVRESISSPRWFPLSSLAGRTGLYADSDPGADGVDGQLIVAGNEVLRPDAYADSAADFLFRMEQTIRNGSVSLGRDLDGRPTWGIGSGAGAIDEFRDVFVGSPWFAGVNAACA
jgi:internalin A